MKILHTVAFVLAVIGGLNWLLDVFNWNVVNMIFGVGSTVTQAIYVLVGLSAIYLIFTHKTTCKMCVKGNSM
ncbi:MAG: DUF378 domain-containing protein [Candidatus Vogelbacteria bacterium]|nr:DUF378 domain-containing protein [Candidatus Vogelbacteria bacterium]